MRTIKVGEKLYAKTPIFGNMKARVVFNNHKKYNRKKIKLDLVHGSI